MNKKESPFIVLKFRDFSIVSAGLFLSQIASQMAVVAINWQIYLMTKSALSLGIIGMARFVPMLLFSLIAGTAADVFNRKKVVFVSQVVLVLVWGALTWLTFARIATPLYIYILIAISTAAITFGSPALSAVNPHLVPRSHFLQAVSFNSLMWQTATIIGPAVGGFVIGLWGIGFVYAATMLLSAFLCVSMLIIKPLPPTAEKQEMNWRSIRQGIGFVRRTPLIWSTMFLDFFATFFASASTLMPIFARDILKTGPQGLGFLYAAPSVGAVLAGLYFSAHHDMKGQGNILLGSILVYGASVILFGFSQLFALSLVCLFVSGAADAVSSIIRNTMRQMITPDNLRGRMISINMIFYTGGPQLGEIEAGIAATLLGTSLSVVAGGAGTLAATIVMALLVPSLRKYENHEEFA